MSITSAKSGATGISLALDNNYMEPIATTVVGSGGVNTIIFNDIPQTYKHLQLRLLARDSRSNTATNLYVQFNGDTGANYTSHSLYGNGSTAVAVAEGANQTSALMTRVSGNSAAASAFGGGVVDILDYANTNKNKTTRSLSGFEDNSVGQIWLVSGLWMSSNPISKITITGVTSPILQYSRFSLYGIRG